MQTLIRGSVGIRLLCSLNWDRVISIVALVLALLLSAYVMSVLAGAHPLNGIDRI